MVMFTNYIATVDFRGMADMISTELDRRRFLRGTAVAGLTGAVGVSGITSGAEDGTSITATTDFDSGGGVEIDQENGRIELTNIDDAGYSFLGYMHFRLEGAANTDVSFNITNLDESRMPANYRLLYTSSLESGDWTRMDDEVEDGFSQTFDSDEVYISGYRAYPYQQTVQRVTELERSYPRFVETDVIGQSANGRDMHAIRITNPAVPDEEKEDIISITRQHPGEVEGSWHMDAAIDYVLETLCDSTVAFEDEFCFHFIPNANPDGMYEGHHRHTPQGYDLNREWNTESPVEIENMMSYMRENLDDVHWGFDFHSTTNSNWDAVVYGEDAVDDDDLDTIDAIASHSLSYPDTTRSSNTDGTAYAFINDEFDAVMVVTEAWTYREYAAAELAAEGRNFFSEVAPREDSPSGGRRSPKNTCPSGSCGEHPYPVELPSSLPWGKNFDPVEYLL
ncbi:peptidase M14, carboxypeptidase A [Natrialba aegyptia DSM 13077]|uniref:Peptidase M14, carboxypeptidase A n=3 Tax=Natrialba aegyptia TaxID=129789 RepID=M0ATX5_9EURY|nr:peptidase M14, carboxypeptidase A [Natrialba aegyptia DSM 13077]